MIPNFEILSKTFSIYMIMALIGVLVSFSFLIHISKKNNIDVISAESMFLASFIGVVIGGHLLYGLGNYKSLIWLVKNLNTFKSFKIIFNHFIVIFGGSVFYGGLFGAIIVCYLFIKIKKLNSNVFLDLSAVIIPLFHTFGRIGCFLSGCCYGIECKYGIIYHYSIIESANYVRRFPVQLLEAAFNLCLFFVLYTLFRQRKLIGNLLNIYLISYSSARFFLEFLRGDSYRGFWGSLSYLQILSLLITVSVVALQLFKYNNKRSKVKKI